MSCIYEKDIYKFIDDKLSGKRKQRFYNHLSTCKTCYQKLENIKLINKALKEGISDDVFESSKDKIITEVKNEKRNYSILSKLYRIRKPIYSTAALLIIFFMICFFKPLINFIQYKNASYSTSNNIKSGSSYVKIPDIEGNNIDIKKLYPSFIPKKMKLGSRTSMGNYVDMEFISNDFLGFNDNNHIDIAIYLGKPNNWNNLYNNKDIKNSNGEWLITVETYPKSNNVESIARISCILNDNIYITICGMDVSKDDILKCLYSLKITDKKLKNDINPNGILSIIGPKLNPNHMTITNSINVLNYYGIKYKVTGASPNEYNTKKLKNFSIDFNTSVITLVAEN